MSDMTPTKAQEWLDWLAEDHGGIRYVRDEMRVPLETLAGMTEEWGAEYGDPATGLRHVSWCEWKADAQEELDHLRANPYNQSPRLIRRYVTTPTEVNDE